RRRIHARHDRGGLDHRASCPLRSVLVPVVAVTYLERRVGESAGSPYRLFVEPMLVWEVSLRGFGSRFASTPGDHVFHFASDATLAQLFLEYTMDISLLVLVLYLVTAFLTTDLARAQYSRFACLPTMGRILARKALIQNQVGGRCWTDVKVLMQPKSLSGSRKIEAAFFPVTADARFVAPLSEHITLAFSNIKMRTRAVAVGLLVVAGFEARDVGLHHTGAHYHEGVGTASAAAL